MVRTARAVSLVPVLLASWTSACSHPPGPGQDSGVVPSDGNPADAPTSRPAAPAAPVSPRLVPCPDGWREIVLEGDATPSTCEPWPVGGVPDCPTGSVALPGEAGCVPVGDPCPAGIWPEDVPSSGPVLYVRPGPTGVGVGTRDEPFGTIAEATAVTSPGTVTILAKGTYAEAVVLGDGLTLLGACAGETVVSVPPESPEIASVSVNGAGVTVRNIGIVGGPHGLRVVGDVEADVSGVSIEGASSFGVAASHGGRLTARSVRVRGTVPNSAGEFGVGVFAGWGGSLELERASIEHSHTWGLTAGGMGSYLRASDVAIRQTEVQPSDGTNGEGLLVTDGATADVTRAVIEGNQTAGVFCFLRGSHLTLADAVVRDTAAPSAESDKGVGVALTGGATATIDRLLVERNRSAGVIVGGYFAALNLADAVVHDSRERRLDSGGGYGMVVLHAATANVARIRLTANRTSAFFIDGHETAVTATDVVAQDTLEPLGGDTSGWGVTVQAGAAFDLGRALLARNTETGLAVLGAGTRASVADLVVRDTRGRSLDRTLGRGATVQDGAVLDLTRAVLLANREAGLLAHSTDTQVTLENVEVRGTLPRDCAATTCADLGAGTGVVALEGSSVSMRRFLLTANALAGVQIGPAGIVRASEGEISENRIGINLQNAGLDIDTLRDRVVFRDNGANLDTTILPVPDP